MTGLHRVNLTETSGRHLIGQHPVGGRYDAHVHSQRFVAAHPLHFALLEHPQQLGLKAEGHFTDFIQKQRALVGLHEPPFATTIRAGKGPLFMPEQFGFQ